MERTIIFCDRDDGRPAVGPLLIKAGGRNLKLDLCQIHMDEMTMGARSPRPGRQAGEYIKSTSVLGGGKRRGRPPGSKNKSTAGTETRTAKSTAKSGNGRRRGRPPKTQTAKSTASSGNGGSTTATSDAAASS